MLVEWGYAENYQRSAFLYLALIMYVTLIMIVSFAGAGILVRASCIVDG
jgi:hypothetical protein